MKDKLLLTFFLFAAQIPVFAAESSYDNSSEKYHGKPATVHTIAFNKAHAARLNFEDRQAFAFNRKGLIAHSKKYPCPQ